MVTTKQTTTKAGGKTTGVIRQEKTVKGKTVEKKTRAKTQGDRKKSPGHLPTGSAAGGRGLYCRLFQRVGPCRRSSDQGSGGYMALYSGHGAWNA